MKKRGQKQQMAEFGLVSEVIIKVGVVRSSEYGFKVDFMAFYLEIFCITSLISMGFYRNGFWFF